MFDPGFVLLYVDDPKASGAFYRELLGRLPIEESPTFVLFVLASGFRLGLWSKHTVEPAASAAGGGGEIAFAVVDTVRLAGIHADWKRRGVPILQEPIDLDFGRTFVGLDPDGHRLRVFVPAG